MTSGASTATKLTEAGTLPRAAALVHGAFATSATAQLFETLGWQVVASSRRHRTYHKPLRCCFVLRDGAREEAAFGYTGVTAPLDGDNPDLVMAQIRVERFLQDLGETSATLVQNTPLIAFGGPRRDRLVVFGGWRFHERTWRPFILGPEGLGGVSIQNTFFETHTAPHHLAEIFGAAADKALPPVTEVVSAIAAFGAPADTRRAPGLRIVPFADGWSLAQPGTPAALMPLRSPTPPAPRLANRPEQPKPLILGSAQAPRISKGPSNNAQGPLNPLAPNALPWEIGEDEFRFRHGKILPPKA